MQPPLRSKQQVRRLFCRCLRFAVLALLIFFENGFAQPKNSFIAVNTLIARPLAMGGAFLAVDDDLAASLYNPANLGGGSKTRAFSFQLFLNPLTPGLALARREDFYNRSTSASAQAFATLGLLIKGLTLRAGPFEVGAILAEQTTNEIAIAASDLFEVNDYLDNQYSVLALRMRLAERVALGGSLGLYYQSLARKQREWQLRASYGITIAPWPNVLLGVSYLTMPVTPNGGYRNHPERFVNGSVNIGMSFRPYPGTIIAADIRNLVEDENKNEMVREPHFGIEHNLFSVLALRGGAFWKSEDERLAYTLGFGLIDSAKLLLGNPRGALPNWLLNYGAVMEKDNAGQRRWIHALTVGIRI